METKRFHLGDLISITDGHLMGPNLMDGVYAVIDFVTGWEHMTHQLLADCAPVKAWLLEQYPFLLEVVAPHFDDEADAAHMRAVCEPWLAEMVAKHGEYFVVSAMPEGQIPWREAIEELRQMVGPDKPIIVVAPDE